MSSVNSNSSRFSYTPQQLIKALDVDEKGYVTEDDIANYRDNNKLSKRSTALLNAIDGANFNDIAMNDGRSSGISLIDFKALAARGGNLNKVEQIDIDRLNRPAPNKNTGETTGSTSYAYDPAAVISALDKKRDGIITREEIYDFKNTRSLGKKAKSFLELLGSNRFEHIAQLDKTPTTQFGLSFADLALLANKSGRRDRLEAKDLLAISDITLMPGPGL